MSAKQGLRLVFFEELQLPLEQQNAGKPTRQKTLIPMPTQDGRWPVWLSSAIVEHFGYPEAGVQVPGSNPSRHSQFLFSCMARYLLKVDRNCQPVHQVLACLQNTVQLHWDAELYLAVAVLSFFSHGTRLILALVEQLVL